MSATASTIDVMKALRTYMLGYVDPDGHAVRETLQRRFYDTRVPDTGSVTFPYAVHRAEFSNEGSGNGLRLRGDMELLVFGRPWAQQVLVNHVADQLHQSLLMLNTGQPEGLIFMKGFQRATLPPGQSPVDSEVVTIRLSYSLIVWPQFLARVFAA